MKQRQSVLWYTAVCILALAIALGWLAARLWGGANGESLEVQLPAQDSTASSQASSQPVAVNFRYLSYQPCSFDPFLKQLNSFDSGMTEEDAKTFSDWRFVSASQASVDGFVFTYGIALPPLEPGESYLVTLGRKLVSMSYQPDSQYGRFNSQYFPSGEGGDKGSPVGNAVLSREYTPGTAYIYAISNSQLEGFDFPYLNEPMIYQYKFALAEK